ncbi:hypothetical protein PG984_000158 [Apiospora sp. TS-2023a]
MGGTPLTLHTKIEMSARDQYRAAVYSAIDDAISSAPHAALKQGMTEEIEVGRSAANTKPQVTLYAKQKNKQTTTTFTKDMEDLKAELGKSDLAPAEKLEEFTKGFEVRFVTVSDSDDEEALAYGGEVPDDGTETTAGGKRFKRAPKLGSPEY